MPDIRKLIERDRSRRIVGIKGVEYLINLDDFNDYKYEFDRSLPHVDLKIKEDDTEPKFIEPLNLPAVADKVRIKNKILSAFPKKFDFSNLLIAGGFISSVIIKRYHMDGDIDIFIHGLDQEQANIKLRELVRVFKKFTGERYIWRNANVVNIGKFQIILRCYTSISEILHGFDIPSCAVGFDGESIWMTEMALFTYKSGFNVIDLTRRSTSYESRLNKYLHRGFGIIFPDLNLSKLTPDCPISKFMKMTFIKFDECPTKLICNFNTFDHVSDYAGEYNQTYKLYYLNLYRILKNEPPIYFIGKDIDNCNLIVDKHIIDMVYQVLNYEFKQEVFRRRKMLRYIPRYTFAQMLEMSTDEFSSCIKQQMTILLEKIERYQKNIPPITWRVDNPGSQLVGSFNPAVITEEEWYN